MSIGNRRRAPGAAAAALAALLQVAFALLAVAPPVVLCHRAGGGTALEVSGPLGSCGCSECEHCRARQIEPASEARDASVAPCHCDHEPLRIEASRASIRRDDGPRDLPPSLSAAALPAGPPRAFELSAASVALSAGPPDRAAGAGNPLRC